MDGLRSCHRRRNLRRLAKIGSPPLCHADTLSSTTLSGRISLSTTVCHVGTCTFPDVRTDIV